MTKTEQLEKFIDDLKLRHFRGRELTPYWKRRRNGVRNSMPPEELWPNIIPTLVVLDALRAKLEAPITLLSTYRSPEYNAAVGGEKQSYHMRFMAIDFTAAAGSPARWAALLNRMRGQKFDLPEERSGARGEWTFRGGIGIYPDSGFVHVDCRGHDANWVGGS